VKRGGGIFTSFPVSAKEVFRDTYLDPTKVFTRFVVVVATQRFGIVTFEIKE
jgi:hypothetical protein